MSIRVFNTNNFGKIEFDRTSLEKLLNEIYEEGYRAGEKHAKDSYWTWCPSITTVNYNTPVYRTLNDFNTNSSVTTSDSTNTNASTMSTNTTNNTKINSNSINNTVEDIKQKSKAETVCYVNGKEVDLSTFNESLKEANEAFNKAANELFHSDRYNALAKEIKNL